MPRPSRTWNRLVSTPLPISTAPSVNTPSTSQRKSLTRRRRARSEDREVEIWRSDMRRGKLQTPSSKHQRSSKSQIPSLRRDSPTINECLDRDAFGALCLGFHWSLVFGVCYSVFDVYSTHRVSHLQQGRQQLRHGRQRNHIRPRPPC